MSEVEATFIPTRLVCIGERDHEGKLIRTFIYQDQPEHQVWFSKYKTWWAIGTIVEIPSNAEKTKYRTVEATAIGRHEDEDQIREWEATQAAHRTRVSLNKKATSMQEKLDTHIEAILGILDSTPGFGKNDARIYVLARLMGRPKK